jgi:hypothetical protein
MVFKRLSSYELTTLWNQIEHKANQLRTASMSHDTVKVYRSLDDLDVMRRRLQSHFAAEAIAQQVENAPD